MGFVRVCLLFVMAVSAGGLTTVNKSRYRQTLRQGSPRKILYLTNNGWHEELRLPRQDCPYRREIDALLGLPEGSGGWYSFGWGDRDFYPSTPYLSDMDPLTTFKALFLPTRAVIEITWIPELTTSERNRAVQVNDSMLSGIYRFVEKWFLRNSEGDPIPLPAGKIDPAYEDSRFFLAKGWYSLAYTCNNWSSDALRAGGVETGLWTPLPWKVGP